MEYLYAALVLHNAGKEITEDGVTSILEAADVEVDESRVKALVAALEDVDVDEAIEQAAAAPTAPAGSAGGAEAEAEEEEDEEEAEEEEAEEEEADDEEAEEDAAEGLGNLFG